MTDAFGQLLRELRKLNSLTQRELAGIVGVSASQLSRIEKGVSEPSQEMSFNLSRALRPEPKVESMFLLLASGRTEAEATRILENLAEDDGDLRGPFAGRSGMEGGRVRR